MQDEDGKCPGNFFSINQSFLGFKIPQMLNHFFLSESGSFSLF